GRGDGRGDRRRRVHRVLRGAEQGRRRVVHAERVVLLRERRGAGEGQRVGRDRDDDRAGRRNGEAGEGVAALGARGDAGRPRDGRDLDGAGRRLEGVAGAGDRDDLRGGGGLAAGAARVVVTTGAGLRRDLVGGGGALSGG